MPLKLFYVVHENLQLWTESLMHSLNSWYSAMARNFQRLTNSLLGRCQFNIHWTFWNMPLVWLAQLARTSLLLLFTLISPSSSSDTCLHFAKLLLVFIASVTHEQDGGKCRPPFWCLFNCRWLVRSLVCVSTSSEALSYSTTCTWW